MHPDNPIPRQFDTVRVNVGMVADGTYLCTAVSGPTGIGKTRTVMEELALKGVWHEVVSGSASIVGIVNKAYQMRSGGVIVADDADRIIIGSGASGANVLKVLLDPGAKQSRTIVWDTKEAQAGKALFPAKFETKARLIWLTNADLSPAGVRQFPEKFRPHIEALLSRGLLPVPITTDPMWILDYILDLIDHHHLLEKISQPLSMAQVRELRAWLVQYAERLRQLSVRLLVSICAPMVSKYPNSWQDHLAHVVLDSPVRSIGALPVRNVSAPAPVQQLALAHKPPLRLPPEGTMSFQRH